MAISIVLSCSMCGAQKTVGMESDKLPPDTKSLLEMACKEKPIDGFIATGMTRTRSTLTGWIVQHNKPYFDVYCCKKCAE